MAIWTATKKNARVEGDAAAGTQVFKIEVDIFADGTLARTVPFESTQPVDDAWLVTQVKQHIRNLEGVPTRHQ
jgi:hypothetical protein